MKANEAAMELAYTKAAEGNCLGCFDEGHCAFSHEKIWKGGYAAALEHAKAENQRYRTALEEAEDVIRHYGDKDNWSHVDGWTQSFDKTPNGYDLAQEYLEKHDVAQAALKGDK